jgi:hypothetical protein
MNIENGINIEVILSDQDLIEVVFSCSNGYFSGGNLFEPRSSLRTCRSVEWISLSRERFPQS